jgi:hypothetical protein
VAITEITNESWFSRIGNSIKGILVGFVLIVVAVVALFWNEGRTVREAKTIAEGRSNVVSVDANTVGADNEGKLVHVTGRAVTTESLADPVFAVKANALRLRRRVEMYQWKETKKSHKKKKLGGGSRTETTYSYSGTWSPRVIDSGPFKEGGHDNPKAMPWKGWDRDAKEIALGAFRLPAALVRQIDNHEPIPAAAEMFAGVADANGAEVRGDVLYLAAASGAQEGEARIGDVRVAFEQVPIGPVSVISKQSGTGFEPYVSETGNDIHMLAVGTQSAAAMFQQREQTNRLIKWAVRLGGFVVMVIGFSLIFRPLSVLGDVVPFVGNIIGAGTFVISLILAAVIWIVVIAIAWLFYRPLIGIGLIVVAVGGIVLLKKLGKKKAPAAVAASPPAAPPPPPPA